MAKKHQRPNKGRIKNDRSEAQKRYLRRHFAEQEELNQDDQWNREGIQRLSYFETMEVARDEVEVDSAGVNDRSNDSARRNVGDHDGSTDEDGIPF